MCLPAQFWEHGGDTKRWDASGGKLGKATTHNSQQQNRYLPFCARRREEHCQSPTIWPSASCWLAGYQTVKNRLNGWWHGGLTFSSGTCVYIPALWSSLIFAREHQNEQVCYWHHVPFHRWEQVHTEHMWQMYRCKESGDAVVNVMCLKYQPAWPVWQWWFGEIYPWRGAQTSMF